MARLRQRVRLFIFSITGILLILLILRMFFDLTDASTGAEFVRFVNNSTQFFVEPFEGLFQTSSTDLIDLNDGFAFLFYLFLGIIIAEIVTSFIYAKVQDVVLNVVDAVFKIFEMILFVRFSLDLFAVSSNLPFALFIYTMTDPIARLVPFYLFSERINVGIIIALIVVVALDFFIEGLIKSIFKWDDEREVNKSRNNINLVTPAPVQYVPVPQPTQQGQPMRQNIHINVPQTSPRPAQPTRRVQNIRVNTNSIPNENQKKKTIG